MGQSAENHNPEDLELLLLKEKIMRIVAHRGVPPEIIDCFARNYSVEKAVEIYCGIRGKCSEDDLSYIRHLYVLLENSCRRELAKDYRDKPTQDGRGQGSKTQDRANP